jgi:amino acid adenylation domain-containing protein
MLGHYQALLESIVADPEEEISRLSLLSEAERKDLLACSSSPHFARPEKWCIHQLFESRVEKSPDALAVVLERKQLTYRELNERANRLAHHLIGMGAGPEMLVGICMERSVEMIVGLLAILKSGAAYVPLDPSYPKERLAFIIEDSQLPLLVTEKKLVNSLPPHQAGVVCIDSEKDAISSQIKENPKTDVTPDNLAYVIYTSGSTGKPKGVLINHYNVARLFESTQSWFNFDENDVWTLFHSYAFDFSVWEIWGALLYGGRLVVVPYWTSRSPEAFYDLLCREQVTVLNQTPSAFRQLIRAEESLGAREDLNLRLVIFGGEALELRTLQPWFERHGEEQPRLVNMYGITETTVHVTYRPITISDLAAAKGSVIGIPIPDLKIHILDQNLQPVPVGVAGEIHVGGMGLGRGYLNRPDLSRERFIADPFSDEPGERLYRSGDLGRYLADGDIEYLGRIDNQVKVRGFRIELGEIESALAEHPGLRESAVVMREDRPGDRRLVAYLVSKQQPVPSISELRNFLKERMPEYMIPSAFVFLERLPLNNNGKLDRRALPSPEGERPDIESAQVAPRNRLEKLLSGIWQEVLGIDNIGIHDNFFDLGGDSIKGAILINKLQERLKEIVHVVVIFDAPNIADLAEYLNKNYPAAVARVSEGDSNIESRSATETIDRAKVEEMLQLIKPLPRLLTGEPKNPPAVFILAPPRSGTTLLRVMLAGHPLLFAPPELELLSFNTLEERKRAFSGRDSFWLEGTMRAIMEIRHCDAERARKIMEEYEEKRLSTKQFYGLMQEWIGEKIVVDKTPSYALDIETLKKAESDFEKPLYIHLLRHPYGMIRSFEEAKLDQIFFRHPHRFSRRELAELIWLVSHQNILEFLKEVPAERRHRVRFEELVKEPKPILEGICRFLGIEYHPGMAEPYKEKEKKMTDGIHPQSKMLGDVKFHTHKGVDQKVADRWAEEYDRDFLGNMTWEMADTLGYRRTQKRLSSLIELQRGGSKEPFFSIHPMGGNVQCYMELARILGQERPFYALQSPELSYEGQSHGSVEEMAAHYIDQIRVVKPQGPYLLGGWSFGGVVAFEMARQLLKRGETVSMLALFDSYAKMRAVDDSLIAARFAGDLAGPFAKEISYDGFDKLGLDEQLNIILEHAKLAKILPDQTEISQLRRLFQVFKNNIKAMQNYIPKYYGGRITLFKAGDRPSDLLHTPEATWRDYSEDRLTVHTIPGNHYTILTRPNVQILAQQLRASLAEAESIDLSVLEKIPT